MLAALREIILAPGVALELGLMISICLILGYIIFDEHTWWRAVLGILLFIVFEEWVRYTIAEKVQNEVLVVLSFLVSACMLVSIGVGVYIAYLQKRYRDEQLEVEAVAIEAIKSDTGKNFLNLRKKE